MPLSSPFCWKSSMVCLLKLWKAVGCPVFNIMTHEGEERLAKSGPCFLGTQPGWIIWDRCGSCRQMFSATRISPTSDPLVSGDQASLCCAMAHMVCLFPALFCEQSGQAAAAVASCCTNAMQYSPPNLEREMPQGWNAPECWLLC